MDLIWDFIDSEYFVAAMFALCMIVNWNESKRRSTPTAKERQEEDQH